MMKKIITFLVALMITSISYAQKEKKEKQEKEIPANIKEAVTGRYPDAKAIKWYMDTVDVTDYNANFKQDKYNYSILISASANIKKTEADIDVSVLPPAIMQYINTNFPKAQIKKAKKTDVLVDAKGTILYTVEIDKKNTPLVFDANGNLAQ